jgi:hypothetical protein
VPPRFIITPHAGPQWPPEAVSPCRPVPRGTEYGFSTALGFRICLAAWNTRESAGASRRRPAFTAFLLRRGVASPGARQDGETSEHAAAFCGPAPARVGGQLHWQFMLRDIPPW